jgi:hypothetical protein
MCWQTLPKSLSERRPEQNDDACLWLRLALDENAVLNNVIEEEEEPKRDEERSVAIRSAFLQIDTHKAIARPQSYCAMKDVARKK